MYAEGVSEASLSNNKVYRALLDEIERIRSELVDLGAKPSEEMLSQLKLSEPLEINGALIDDFADFEDRFGRYFDIWGVYHEVNATYGTYYTYDIMFCDYDVANEVFALSYTVEDVFEINNNSALLDAFENEARSVVFDKIAGYLVDGALSLTPLNNASDFFLSLIHIADELASNDVVSFSDVDENNYYRIGGRIDPIIHFVYVRDSLDVDWEHTLVTNRVNVDENHTWSLFYTLNGDDRNEAGGEEYSHLLIPEDYGFRLTNAIATYRSNKQYNLAKIYVDRVDSYKLVATIQDEEIMIKDIYIDCPESVSGIFRFVS